MKRILKIFIRSFKISLMTDMEYRASFFVIFFQAIIFIIFNLLFYRVVIGNIGGIGSWGYWDMVILFGAFNIVDGIFMSIILSNVNEIGRSINNGMMDLYLIRPIDTQLFLATKRFQTHEIPSIFLGIAIVIYGLIGHGYNISALSYIGFVVMIVCSSLLFYAMSFMLLCITFYIEKSDEISEIIFSLKQFSKLPDIYSGWVRYVFMFAAPVVFSSFVPAGILLNKTGSSFIGYYLIITIVFLVLSRVVWKIGLKRYKSAGG